MKKKFFKRLIASALVTTLTINACVAAYAEEQQIANTVSIVQEQKGFEPVIQCENFDMQCGASLIAGEVEKTEDIATLHDGIMSMLDEETVINTNDYLGDSVISNETDMYSVNMYNANAGTVNLSEVIVAENSIGFSASEVNGDGAILYSKNGDINFYCGNVNYTGIIYAPNGTVRFEGSNIDINGVIIAENVVVRASTFNITSDIEILSYVQELDFYEETKQQSLSVVKEDGEYRMFWDENAGTSSTDIYVRYDGATKFTCIDSTLLSEYILSDCDFDKCDFRIVSDIFGENITSNIVTLYFDDNGILNEERIDTDEDLIPDGYEIWDMQTNPYNNDTDEDGIFDGYEVLMLNSNPCEYDSEYDYDFDGSSNYNEFVNGTNPWSIDTDFDGIDDMADEYATKPLIGEYSSVNIDSSVRVGKFDIVNKYIVDGVEQEYVYNYITQETTYSRLGESYTIKYMDVNGNIQSVVSSMTDEDENVQDAVIYDYNEEGYLEGISNNGVTYEFEYDENYRMTNSYVNGKELISYDYFKGSDIVSSMALGNGNVKSYKNDEAGNVVEKYEASALVATYEYDENNNLVKSTDLANGINCEYIYSDNELKEVSINDNLTVKYNYEDGRYNTTIEYDGKIYNQLATYTEGSYSIELSSGEIYNVTQIEENVYNEQIVSSSDTIYSNVYKISGRYDTGETTQQIDSMHTNSGDNYIYEYDDKNNIIEIYKNDCLEKKFEYNIYSELICEYDFNRGEKREYKYNKRGNIINSTITRLEDMFLNVIHEYEYNDVSWMDLFTSIDGKDVIYDEIGNPLIYGDAVMTWTNDAMLKSVAWDDNYVEYIYDISGNRIAKNVNGVLTKYITDGSLLLGKEVNNSEVWYIYNDLGKAIGFTYNGDSYYYEKDIFNSVKNVLDVNGNVVCSYEYDAWGNILDIKGDEILAKINDYRYQSYIYDEETGFYYLISRYYDSNNYRFINADSVFSSSNLFVYCQNNPTNLCDPSGKSPIASVSGSNEVFVSDWGYEGIGYKLPSLSDAADENGYFYNTSTRKKVYFNCYLWALNRYYTVNDKNCNPGIYKYGGNTSEYYIFYLLTKYTVDHIYSLVREDATELGCSVKSASSPNSSVSSGQRLIALRTTTTSSSYYTQTGKWDYHFMKKIGNTWTYKAGWSDRIFEVGSSYTPSTVSWDMTGWNKNTNRWSVTYKKAYTSTIKYFIYTY